MSSAAARRLAGVELGGTKCICTLADPEARILGQRTIPTTTPAETLAAILTQLGDWHREGELDAIGIGSFGPIDLDPRSAGFGRIQRTPKPRWEGADIYGAIAATFDCPIRLDTDVNAAALAEHRWGGGPVAGRLAYVTVGTGIGVGFAGVHAQPPGYHAELGHVRAAREPGDTRTSVCGFHADCIEGFASGPAIRASMGEADPGAVPLHDPRWADVAGYLGQLCHVLVSGWRVDRIAFGGGVIIGNPGLVEQIETRLRQSLNGYLALPQDRALAVRATLGADAGPLGTIALASDALAFSDRP